MLVEWPESSSASDAGGRVRRGWERPSPHLEATEEWRNDRDTLRAARTMVGKLVLALVGVLSALLAACSTDEQRAEPPARRDFFFGFADDAFKLDPAGSVPSARDLGAKAVRITLFWNPGQTELDPDAELHLDQAVALTAGMRIVVSVYADSGGKAPVNEGERRAYCSYVRALLTRYPTIRDVVIWNEPNKSFFWRPQFGRDGRSAAPAAYVALLARCWDVLHAARREVNLVAPATSPRGNDNPEARSNVSHSPEAFLRAMGEAYRASGRTRPIFDTVAHHAYTLRPADRPWKSYEGGTITQGDWDKLMRVLTDAFEGTAQPIPGECADGSCVAIWYMEMGFQTRPDPEKTAVYTGVEKIKDPLPDVLEGASPAQPLEDSPAPDQATQIEDSVKLAYCQPHVEGFFNFLLWDEPRLEGWQSGAMWADHTPKDSYGAFKRAVADVSAGHVDCSAFRAASPDSD